MVTILIVAAMLSLVALAFKLFWRNILDYVAKAVKRLYELSESFVKFVYRNAKAVAYIIRWYVNGRITREKVDEIDADLCPDEVRNALKEGKEVKVHVIK